MSKARLRRKARKRILQFGVRIPRAIHAIGAAQFFDRHGLLALVDVDLARVARWVRLTGARRAEPLVAEVAAEG